MDTSGRDGFGEKRDTSFPDKYAETQSKGRLERPRGAWGLESDNPMLNSSSAIYFLASCSSSLILSFFILKMDIGMAFSYVCCEHILRK